MIKILKYFKIIFNKIFITNANNWVQNIEEKKFILKYFSYNIK
jgi:hypothetical protein